MEKAISVEDRIRRAEEIYSRRNGQYVKSKSKKTEKNKSKTKKLIMQIFICLLIYLAFYVFTNSDYIFSEEFLNQVRGIFNEDSTIYNTYLNIKSFIEQKLSTDNEPKVENQVENEQEDNKENENNEKDKKDTASTNKEEDSIGGAEEIKQEAKKEETKTTDNDKKENKTKMEINAEEVKKKISFIVPVKGRISSTFGWRTPTTKTVPRNHTGLDIAAETGTVIKSATDGEVILVSSKGDYGKHYQIKTGDVVLVYAHCSKLYLKEGAKVKQGDKIADVGSTGNSTGPHLHFEIRKGEDLIDPELILDI